MSLRDLPPVDPNVERPERLSQSFLSHMDSCARSGFLYLQNGGGVASHAMQRGEAFHEFARRFVELIVEQGENSAPPEIAKDVLASVIADRPDLQLPERELDALRVMAHHMAEGLWIEPDKVVALEKMLELQVDGAVIRGRVDFASINLQTHHATIRDYKTGFNIGSQSDFEKSWQCRFYGLLLAEGIGEDDPVSLGKDIDTFKVEEVYPAYKSLPTREAVLTRQQLRDFQQDVEAVIARADHGFGKALWPAVPGDHCSRCPAPQSCPLPSVLIPMVMPDDDLEGMAERALFLDSELRATKKKLKAGAEQHGSIPAGKGLEFRFDLVESERVKDVAAVKGLLAAQNLDEADYITKSVSTRFDKRKVKSNDTEVR